MTMKTRSRREFLKHSASLTALAAVSPALAAATPERPNVLIVLADDLGYHDLGCYGGEIPTPHIDALAASGIRFTDYYAAAPVCTPSRFGLLTGRHPHYSREKLIAPLMPGETMGIAKDETCLAEMMKAAGYQTALIGKWHLGKGRADTHPNNHGFDLFTGLVGGAVDYWTKAYGTDKDWWVNNKPAEEKGYATDFLARHAVNYLKGRQGAASPFFLYLSLTAPHYGKSDGKNLGPGTWVGGKSAGFQNTLQAPQAYLDRFSAIQDPGRRHFAAMVASMDDAVGAVMKTLRETRLDQNTLVFFLSDNGGSLPYGGRNDPFTGEKGTAYEGGFRVPGMVNWPGKFKAGTVVSQPVSGLDLVPTLADYCGLRPDFGVLNGINLRPVLELGAVPEREIWGYYHRDKPGVTPKQKQYTGSLRRGKWKYLRDDDREFLFDLSASVKETEQEDRKALNPEIFSQLKKRYAELSGN